LELVIVKSAQFYERLNFIKNRREVLAFKNPATADIYTAREFRSAWPA
jgi:hypothetical protein